MRIAFVVVLPQSVATITLILSGSRLFIKDLHLRNQLGARPQDAHPYGFQILRLRTIAGDRMVRGSGGFGEDLQATPWRRRGVLLADGRSPRLPSRGLQEPQENRFFQQ